MQKLSFQHLLTDSLQETTSKNAVNFKGSAYYGIGLRIALIIIRKIHFRHLRILRNLRTNFVAEVTVIPKIWTSGPTWIGTGGKARRKFQANEARIAQKGLCFNCELVRSVGSTRSRFLDLGHKKDLINKKGPRQ